MKKIILFLMIFTMLFTSAVWAGESKDEPQSIAMTAGKAAVIRFLNDVTYGNTGDAVAILQQKLKDLGYLASDPDGSYGPLTRKAVHLFQETAGLEVNDVISVSVIENNPIENPGEAVDIVPVSNSVSAGANTSHGNINGFGTAGRLTIPELGIDVALFWVNMYDLGAQARCDAWDSAVRYSDCPLLGDHNDQEFAPLPGAQPGMIMYIQHSDGSCERYTCVDTGIGWNSGENVYDQYGTASENFRYLTLYTCYNGWQHPFVCQWAAF